VRKICDEPVCFVVSLKEVKKYGLCPLGQLKKNPEAKLLFPKKLKEVKKTMYAIIYWADDSTVFPVLNEDGTLKLFNSLGEADDYANELEPNDYYRVISIEGVEE